MNKITLAAPDEALHPSATYEPAEPKDVTLADTGLGTTFERWALNRYLAQLQARIGAKQVFEGLGDGMTGIAGLNSVPFGLGRAEVTLALPHPEKAAFARQVWATHAPQARLHLLTEELGLHLPFENGAFDLVWNFNVMTRPDDPLAWLSEMARISRRYVLIFVPNRQNYAFWLHRLHHRVARNPWDHGRIDLMHPAAWQRWFPKAGLRVEEVTWVDCPWWPDIVDLGQMIADFVPPLKNWANKARPENRLRWAAEDLPYYRPEAYPDIHAQMKRLAFFENSRLTWLKKRFAHHVGILGVKTQEVSL